MPRRDQSPGAWFPKLASRAGWAEGSNDPDFEAKKNGLELYAIADGGVAAGPDDPTVVFCYDEFGRSTCNHPGRQWAVAGGGAAQPRRSRRATFTRPHGVRHSLADDDLSTNRVYGHVKVRKGRTEFLAFMRYLRSLHPPGGAHRRRDGQLQSAPHHDEGLTRR